MPDGYIEISDQGGQTCFLNDGQFSFTASGSITINPSTGYPQYTRGASRVVNLSGATQDIGNLEACDELTTGTVTDIDGNVYKTVKIGSQWWMAENLRTSRYNNGDSIPNLQNSNYWTNYTLAWSYYDNNSTNHIPFGRLYQWDVVGNGFWDVCPVGWHVPSNAEWNQLISYLGGSAVAGGKMKSIGNLYWVTFSWKWMPRTFVWSTPIH